MPTVVGVRLRFSKTLWFSPAGSTSVEGDMVLVETERGTEIGTVKQAPHEVTDEQLPAPLKPVLRVADAHDLARLDELAELEREAMPVFRQLVVDHKLDMKPVDVEYLFDGDKIVFYFSAEERVDFRELVRELASRFKARIDMRQVGVRDEARMVGGVGHCGQMLCCVRFGGEFQPVSIRMAKEQDLPLNPLKISGLCGRLMCCLRYEFDAYKDYKSRAPKRGAVVEAPGGSAKVTDLNTPKETVTLRLEDGTNVTVPLASMQCAKGGSCPCSVSKEAIDAVTGPPAGVLAAPAAEPRVMLEASGETLKRQAREPKEQPKDLAGAEGTGGGRRRRRRGKSSSEAQPAEQSKTKSREAAKPAEQSKPQKAPKSSAEADAAEGDKPGRTVRRRRRRRPGGSGGAGEGSA